MTQNILQANVAMNIILSNHYEKNANDLNLHLGNSSSVTHLRVSIDFHLLSKVNFDRVGPELGPLLWCNER